MAALTSIAIGVGAASLAAGTVQSISQARKASKAQKQQKALLEKKEQEISGIEEDRQKRILKARQGRQSLLYKEGTEAGVSTTLGGGQ